MGSHHLTFSQAISAVTEILQDTPGHSTCNHCVTGKFQTKPTWRRGEQLAMEVQEYNLTTEERGNMFAGSSYDVIDPPCALPLMHHCLQEDTGTPDSDRIPLSGRSSGKRKEIPFSQVVTPKMAFKAAERLRPVEVVSLFFLLLNDVEMALKECSKALSSKASNLVGPWFLHQLVKDMQRKKLERWDVKLACGLHLLRKYRIIRELFGLTAEDAKKKFEGTEYFYFSEPKERFRVGIFKLSFNLSWDDTRSLLSKLDGDEPTDEKALLEYHTLRILKRHGPGSAEKVLAKIHKESQMWNGREDLPQPHPLGRNESDCGKILLRTGFCLIFHQEKYTAKIENRTGASVDLRNIRETFSLLGCQGDNLVSCVDFDGCEIREKVKSLGKRRENPSKIDFFVCVLMGHGERKGGEDVFYGADGDPVAIERDIVRFFSSVNQCPWLSEVPKIFIIQACRGRVANEMKSFGSNRVASDGAFSRPHPAFTIQPAAEADIKNYCKFNSTISDFVSFRNVEEGSYMITCLCLELKCNSRQKSILEMLQDVMTAVSNHTGVQQPAIEFTIGNFTNMYWVESNPGKYH